MIQSWETLCNQSSMDGSSLLTSDTDSHDSKSGHIDTFLSFFQWFTGKISLYFILLTGIGCNGESSGISKNDRPKCVSLSGIHRSIWWTDTVHHELLRCRTRRFRCVPSLYRGSNSNWFGNLPPSFAIFKISVRPPKSMLVTIRIATKPLYWILIILGIVISGPSCGQICHSQLVSMVWWPDIGHKSGLVPGVTDSISIPNHP